MITCPSPEGLRRRSGRKWNRYPADVIPAWIADMDFDPAPVIADALHRAVALGDLGYGPTAADSLVPQTFAAWAERRWQWRVDPADVMLMPDVVGGIANCIEALTAPGDAVMVHTPAYPPLLSSVKIAGRRLMEVELEVGAIDFAALDRRLAESRARMLLLCHPHNPSGRVFTHEELANFGELAEIHDLVVVSDEVHADLTLDGRVHATFANFAPSRTVTLNAPSKAFNIAGLRTAVCVAPAPLRARLNALPPTRWNAFSTLGIRAALAAWSDEGEAWLQALLRQLESNRALIDSRLHAMGIRWLPPQASYLAWLDCPAIPEDPAAFFLREARVALSPGPDFGPSGKGHARLNFATSPQILGEILDRMASAL